MLSPINLLRSLSTATLITLAALSLTPAQAVAGKCNNTPFNPITDVTWDAVFPLRVGGVKVKQGPLPDSSDGGNIKSPICICTNDRGTWLGLEVGFWDLNNMVEVVREPGCSPILGKGIAMNDRGFHGGTNESKTKHPNLFKQAHWVKFPVMSIIGMMTDMTCAAKGGFDYAYLTEFDPAHNNDLIAVFRRPDNFIFAFPAFDLLQPANVMMTMAGDSGVLAPAYDSIFWLWWDQIYPLSGSKNTPADLEGSAQIAAKQIYSFYGTGLLRDNVRNSCQSEVSFIPKKSHWRFQIAKPVKTPKPFIPGMSEFLWGMGGKNPPFKEGNFLFVLFQRKRCCEALLGGATSGGSYGKDTGGAPAGSSSTPPPTGI